MADKVIGYVILEDGVSLEPNATIIDRSYKGKHVMAEGITQTAEEENRNGRCYLLPDLHREIHCARTMELLSTGNMKAENGHPMDTSMVRQQTIDPEHTVAKFLTFWEDGNDIWAKFIGTNNDAGRDFEQDLLEGELPSWSLRALGSLENVRGRNVVRNLKMITYDRVIFPSHPGAYTKRIVSESTVSGMESVTSTQVHENGLLVPVMNESVMNYIKSESANIRSVLEQVGVFYESAKLLPGNSVQMVTHEGDIFVVHLESYIANEIGAYCADHQWLHQ